MISPVQWDIATPEVRLATLRRWADRLPEEDRRRVEWLLDEHLGEAEKARKSAEVDAATAEAIADSKSDEVDDLTNKLDRVRLLLDAVVKEAK